MDTRYSEKYVKLLLGTTPGQKHLEIKGICLRTCTDKSLHTRGGVEDTRLEAKDRPFRGQGPRTQMQVFSEKKVFKIFFRRSQKKSLQKIFLGEKGL